MLENAQRVGDDIAYDNGLEGISAGPADTGKSLGRCKDRDASTLQYFSVFLLKLLHIWLVPARSKADSNDAKSFQSLHLTPCW